MRSIFAPALTDVAEFFQALNAARVVLEVGTHSAWVRYDANSEIYYAQLVEEEATATVLAGLKEVVECQGVFCALYSDCATHFWLTPKAGEEVDHHRLTQVGRALRELGVQMIPAYSPQARGRSEHSFGTWQGRAAAGTAVA